MIGGRIPCRTVPVTDVSAPWLLPEPIDAVEGKGAGAGVGPDAVADVVHHTVGGDSHANVVGALAAHFPP